MPIASAKCRQTPALIDGLSWSALALVLAFCALASLEAILAPSAGVVGSGGADMVLAWLSRIAIFMVSGITVLITALVVLNAAGRAGRLKPALAVAAAVAGCLVASVTRYVIGATPVAEGPAFMVSTFISWFLPAAALVTGYVFYLHTRAVREQANAAELRRAALEKQQLETRLRLLQAQIEPHFLFNTLSNVRRLCQSDAVAGRAMLAQLTRYLRAALPRMRDHDASLADEIELVAAFLGVQKIRMGARLESLIDVPESLLHARVPSMMLATLVENAIKHGIAPLAEGGTIRVAAAREDETLLLSVADTGHGFAAASGSGVGLANIRARLGALYGEGATLRLEANSPRGVVATVTLPWTGGEQRP
jgi:signal transduction histidine kinase